MCSINKLLKVVGTMFPDSVVSIGTKHRHSSELTILLNGRVEFNPVAHRRDMVDTMFYYNLYVKRLENELYEAGSHDQNNTETKTDIRPGMAIAEMAFMLL